jgi:hypothetical protein
MVWRITQRGMSKSDVEGHVKITDAFGAAAQSMALFTDPGRNHPLPVADARVFAQGRELPTTLHGCAELHPCNPMA